MRFPSILVLLVALLVALGQRKTTKFEVCVMKSRVMFQFLPETVNPSYYRTPPHPFTLCAPQLPSPFAMATFPQTSDPVLYQIGVARGYADVSPRSFFLVLLG